LISLGLSSSALPRKFSSQHL
ncbi:unnamed protein product, partial [Adineta steineri]